MKVIFPNQGSLIRIIDEIHSLLEGCNPWSLICLIEVYMIPSEAIFASAILSFKLLLKCILYL